MHARHEADMDHGADTQALWRQMHDRLLSYIRRRVPTVHDAEDILQEVFLRIHTNRHRLEDVQRVAPWVYRITRNAITDQFRRRAASSRVHQEVADQGHGDAYADAPASHEAVEPSVELARCLAPLLDDLPPAYRDAVALTELDGLTQKEAAGRLGLSVSGVKSRVQRGRAQLKELLLACCDVELDGRRGVIGYEPRQERACDCCGPCKPDAETAAGNREAIYRYIHGIVRDAAEADDLTQETMLRAHTKLSTLADNAKLRPWLYRIATNVCHDRFRQASRRRRPLSLDVEANEAGDGAAEAAVDDAPRLDKAMEQQEMSACVQKYVAGLSDSYRAVIMLHDTQGLTNPEIAQMLGVSLATVKIRLHRARTRLRAALADACQFSCDERGVTVCEPKCRETDQ